MIKIFHVLISAFYLFYLLYFIVLFNYLGSLNEYKAVFMSVNYFSLIYFDIMYLIIKKNELRKIYYYFIANILVSLSIIYFVLISINFVYNTFSIDLQVEEPEKNIFNFLIICLSTVIFFYNFLFQDITYEKINKVNYFVKNLFFTFCGLLCFNLIINNLINFHFFLNNFHIFNKCIFEVTYFMVSSIISIFYLYCMFINKRYFTEIKYSYMQLSYSTLIFFVILICLYYNFVPNEFDKWYVFVLLTILLNIILLSLIIIWDLNLFITTIFFFMSTSPLFLWLLTEKPNETINKCLQFLKTNQQNIVNFFSAVTATIIGGLILNFCLKKKNSIDSDYESNHDDNDKQLIIPIKDKEIINYLSNKY